MLFPFGRFSVEENKKRGKKASLSPRRQDGEKKSFWFGIDCIQLLHSIMYGALK